MNIETKINILSKSLFKKISTKNLYLCELRQIYKEYYNIYTCERMMYFCDEKRYVFVIKDEGVLKSKFIDVFTGTEYKIWNDNDLVEGKWCIKSLNPIITDYKYVSLDILVQSLKELNPTFFLPQVEKKSIKQKLLSFSNK